MKAKVFLTDPTDAAHDPSSSIVVEYHSRGFLCGQAARSPLIGASAGGGPRGATQSTLWSRISI